ncbi:MAG: RNA polymerase sigma factor [Planctomycetes bacterium]|nr:RNA polymerase sigma factor [Planctomycetota bacterium]
MALMATQEPQDTRELVSAARDGDRAAFEALVARHRGRIRALVASRLEAWLALGADADDVYQETLLRALKSIARLEWRGEGSFLRWLGGIADNVILELSRKRARERQVALDGLDVRVPAADASPSRALRREERLERLEGSLASLSPDHRRVIVLTRIEGLTFEEAAQRMGRSADAVKQLLYRALKELKEAFGDTESLHLPDRGLPGAEGGSDGR